MNRWAAPNNTRVNVGVYRSGARRILNVTEQSLLDAIVRGDKSAMRELYVRYLPRLARFLYRVTRDQELIEELANDVMMTVWQRATDFRRESALSTWILGIAYRKALDAVRSRKRYDDMISSLPEPSTEEGTQHFLAQRELDRMLALLSPEQRAVAELSFDFGYSYPEIAEILGIPVNTVKTRMFYARQTMQACYGSSSEGTS